MFSPFSKPNNELKAPVNRMIQKLIIHRDKLRRACAVRPKMTSHGNPTYLSPEQKEVESRKYAKINTISRMIKQLEQIAY